IRRFRPQIIIAVFSGTPADGHGHHQVSAILARQAFDLLRDSTWGPQKFYRSTRGDPTATTVSLPVGILDPILAQSYFQVAMAGPATRRDGWHGAANLARARDRDCRGRVDRWNGR